MCVCADGVGRYIACGYIATEVRGWDRASCLGVLAPKYSRSAACASAVALREGQAVQRGDRVSVCGCGV